MAGLGRKVWTRETLSATELQGYLQDQVVMTFASAAARDAAVPSPTEGMMCTLTTGTERLQRHDGTAWRNLPRSSDGGLFTGTTNATGDVVIPHGLGVTPTRVTVVPAGSGLDGQFSKPSASLTQNNAHIPVRVYDTRTGAAWASAAVNIWWTADLL